MISTCHVALAAADGAEVAAHVPDRVGPAAQQPLGVVGARGGGEVEVVVQRGRASRRGPGRRPAPARARPSANRAPSSSMHRRDPVQLGASPSAGRRRSAGAAARRRTREDSSSRSARSPAGRVAPATTTPTVGACPARRRCRLPSRRSCRRRRCTGGCRDGRGARGAPAAAPQPRRRRPRGRGRRPAVVTIDSHHAVLHPRRAAPDRSPGTVTNDSDETWTASTSRLHRPQLPITSTAELAAAADRDPTADVGDRITVPGTFDTIDELAPGESAPLHRPVCRAELPESASPASTGSASTRSATTPAAATSVADGRARTFLPLVPPQAPRHRRRPSLVAARCAAGRAAPPTARSPDVDALGAPPRRRAAASTACSTSARRAGAAPLTWLVDPAVPDAVAGSPRGNPPRTLVAPDRGARPRAGETAEPASRRAPTPRPGDARGADDRRGAAADEAHRSAAARWLDRLQAALSRRRRGPGAARTATSTSSAAAAHDRPARPGAPRAPADVMAALGLAVTRAVGAAGRLPAQPRTPSRPAAATTVLLGDNVASAARAPDAGRRSLGHDGRASPRRRRRRAAPARRPADDPLALRQRMLSEAALRLLRPDHAAAGRQLPDRLWHPRGRQPASSPGSTCRGCDLTRVDDATGAARAEPRSTARLGYTAAGSAAASSAPAHFAAANRAATAGRALQSGAHPQRPVRRARSLDEAPATLSYAAPRRRRRAAARRPRAPRCDRATSLGGIDVEAPASVTLSSDSRHVLGAPSSTASTSRSRSRCGPSPTAR